MAQSPIQTSSTNNEERLPGITIPKTQPPPIGPWAYVPMFKTNQRGKQMMWQVGFDGVDRLHTIHGQIGGKIRHDPIEGVLIVQKGGHSMIQQAVQEAQKRYTDKHRKGYRPKGEKGTGRMLVQLAKKYWPPMWGKIKDHIDGNLKFPVAVQCKLDGVRASAYLTKDDQGQQTVKLYSRTDLEWQHVELIRQQLIPLFAYLPEGIGIDLELYKHGVPLNILQSWASTEKTIHPNNKLLEAHIFDIILPNVSYDERYMMLVKAYQKLLESGADTDKIYILRNYWARSHQDIIDFHNKFVEQGCEGLMIRHLYGSDKTAAGLDRSTYKSDKNINLLKFKVFEEEEVIITEVSEGKGKDKGLAIFTARNNKGNIYKVRPATSNEERANWFGHPDQVIGRLYTVRHFGLTVNDVHRFSVGKGFRDVPQRPGQMAF